MYESIGDLPWCTSRREEKALSDNPFAHSNSFVAWTLPRLLAIVDKSGGTISANSERDAANTCLDKLKGSTRLGRTTKRRRARMLTTVCEGIKLGYLSFNPKVGLRLTQAGHEVIERRRSRYNASTNNPNGRSHGRQQIVPT